MRATTSIEFPVNTERLALRVTDMDFRIEPDESQAYVNLDGFRDTKYRSRIFKQLNVKDGKLEPEDDGYKKILFSGHPGSGKTLELKRLHGELNRSDCFTSIFIGLEEQLEVDKMQPEDFFILLVTNLAERMQGLNYRNTVLQSIADDWLSDKEITEEVTRNARLEARAEINAGGSLLSLLKLKAGLKSTLASNSKATEKLRRKVRENPQELIMRFNLAIQEARSVEHANLGRDILFIMDGSEKASLDLYQKIFVTDSYLLRSLACHAIFSVPIKSYFDIEKTSHQSFPHRCSLPMIRINESSSEIFSQIVSKRLAADLFFEKKALDYCVRKSGGCPRQLLRIVNLCLQDRADDLIDLANAKEVCDELGHQLRDLLRSEHLKVLESGDFKRSDPPVLEMLYQLILIKYNGHREINPLLEGLV